MLTIIFTAPDGAAPKQSLVLKCHLAFIAPVSYYWSHTSIDKFNEYAQKYTALAITIPSVVNSATESTGVILWGFVDRKVNASEANIDGWQNINLQMIFQGVARTIVDIDSFDYRSKRETNYDEQLFEKKTRPAGQTDELFSIQVFIGKTQCPSSSIENYALNETIFCRHTSQHRSRVDNLCSNSRAQATRSANVTTNGDNLERKSDQ